jgi:putative ABC transport system substrate-binding protein
MAHWWQMRRREFITLLGGAGAAWPLAARGQQSERMRRIGFLHGFAENDPQSQAEITAFRQGLQRLGWACRNIRIAYRWGQGEADRIRTVARELIALQPEAVLAASTPAVKALSDETHTVPIVFVRVADPLGDNCSKRSRPMLSGPLFCSIQ